jgi:hypothetical protein
MDDLQRREFHEALLEADGSSWCRLCHVRATREWRRKQKEARSAARREESEAFREELARRIAERREAA